MPRATILLALLILVVRAAGAPAQVFVPGASVTRLAWGTVNVLVQADTTNGVLVWAETSPIAYQAQQQAFAASFDPETMDSWLNLAHGILTATTPPSESTVALATPPLVARDGSRLVVLRRRQEGKWESHASILLLDREERHPWYIDTDQQDAEKFLQALLFIAASSNQRTQSPAVHDWNPLDATGPRALSRLVPRYPEDLRRFQKAGEVWMSYVVQPDGTADSASCEVLLSDDRDFTNAVLEVLRHARFRPAQVGGVSVATRVHQRFIFRPFATERPR